MFKVFQDWLHRYFSDEQAVVLAVLLVLGFAAILNLGGMLAPVLTGLVLAFLMQGLVNAFERLRLPQVVAVWLVFTLFLSMLGLFLLVLMPLLWQQLSTLFNELPRMLGEWQSLFLLLPERYPTLITDVQVLQLIEGVRGEVGKFGQWALSFSLSSLPMLVSIMIYLVLVPILVFFFLKDRDAMLNALARVAMEKRDLTLLSLHTEHSQALCAAELQGHLRQRVFFVGRPSRPAVNAGLADYVPAFLSEIPKLFRSGEQKLDTAIIQVSLPDKHGLCSLGISVEATRAALQSAKKIIAQINPKMPRTHGDSFVHLSDFDGYCELESQIPLHLPATPDPVTSQIGRNVASLVRDGDCLQMGIGAIPDATLACLFDRQNPYHGLQSKVKDLIRFEFD